MYLCADLVSAVLEFNQDYQMIDCNLCLEHFVVTDSFQLAFANYSMMSKIGAFAPKDCYGTRLYQAPEVLKAASVKGSYKAYPAQLLALGVCL